MRPRGLGWIAAPLIVLTVAGGAFAAHSRFTDVTDDHPVDAIEWAADQRITVGYGDGTFRPDEPLKRAHARIFVERYYDQVLGADGDDQHSNPAFTRADMMTVLYSMATGNDTAPPVGGVSRLTIDVAEAEALADGSAENCDPDEVICLLNHWTADEAIVVPGAAPMDSYGYEIRNQQVCPNYWAVTMQVWTLWPGDYAETRVYLGGPQVGPADIGDRMWVVAFVRGTPFEQLHFTIACL